jgi:hypothetical protein
VPVLNATAEGCTSNPITAGSWATKAGTQLAVNTVVDGSTVSSFTVSENTGTTALTKVIYGLAHSTEYTFSVLATNEAGLGGASEASVPVTTPTQTNCLLSDWGVWSACDVLWQRKRQCGEYVCRRTACGTQVCGRRMCNTVDITVINFNVNPNATAGYEEINTEAYQNRTRYLVSYPQNGGTDCPLTLTQYRPCCSTALINKVVDIGGVKSVCNGTDYVDQTTMGFDPIADPDPTIKMGDGNVMANTASCGTATGG